MENDNDYSLMNVVKHLKYYMENTYGDFQLILQYKYAKPNESTEGNKNFDKIIQASNQKIIVMNANREMKKKPYVHLKSMTYPNQFRNFRENIKSFQKQTNSKSTIFHKIDLNFKGQKISFQSEMMKWVYKNRKMLFRPSYETVKDEKLFRIALYSQAKRQHEPKKKVIEILKEAISLTLEEEKILQKPKIQEKNQKKQETKEFREIPLRFKNEETIILNKWFKIVMSIVFQTVNIKLYQQIMELVNTRKNSNNEMIGKLMLTELVQEIFVEFQKELNYQVELRFSPELIKKFDELDEEQIEQVMSKAASFFIKISKDPKQFSVEQIISELQAIQNIL